MGPTPGRAVLQGRPQLPDLQLSDVPGQFPHRGFLRLQDVLVVQDGLVQNLLAANLLAPPAAGSVGLGVVAVLLPFQVEFVVQLHQLEVHVAVILQVWPLTQLFLMSPLV